MRFRARKMMMGLLGAGVLLGSVSVGAVRAERFGLAGEYTLAGAGARSAALGNAYAGVADDATALYWNPGGLGQVKLIELSLSHSMTDGRLYYDFAGFVQPLLGVGTIGLGVITLNGAQYEPAGLTFTAAPAALHDTVLTAAWGREILAGLSVGAGLKGHSLTLGDETASALGADAGIFYRTPWPVLALGVAVQNVLPPVLPLTGIENRFARLARCGLSLTGYEGRLSAAAEADRLLADDAEWNWGAGAEAKPWPALAVRAGYRDRAWSAGLGYDGRDWRLDYAAVRGADAQFRHWISLTCVLGAYNAKVKVEPKTFSRASLNKICTFAVELPDRKPIRRWQFLVRRADTGALVKTFSRSEVPETIVWDGRDDQDRFLPERRYLGELVGADEDGNCLRSNLAEVAILEPTVIKVTTQEEKEKEEKK